jgi:hypothetical protein
MGGSIVRKQEKVRGGRNNAKLCGRIADNAQCSDPSNMPLGGFIIAELGRLLASSAPHIFTGGSPVLPDGRKLIGRLGLAG